MKSNELEFWTHESIRPFAGEDDPIAVMARRADDLVLDAIEKGWIGPPFDPIQLANILEMSVIPCDSIRDARLIAAPRNRFRIEYNPSRPRTRIQFSIAHEIAHTFFPDCRERVRNRTTRYHQVDDDWQLEMLCNVGAAELLMPAGSFPEIGESEFSIDLLLQLRERFHVSTEAVLIRFAKRSRIPCAVFAASRQPAGRNRVRVDYLLTANDWNLSLPNGFAIPPGSVAYDCGAIGYTAKGDEVWDKNTGLMRVECVAVPSYPGSPNPRVLGLLGPTRHSTSRLPTIEYVIGDATKPRGRRDNVIAHVVNNATPRWGGGFARIVKTKWPEAQKDFVESVVRDRSMLRLGKHRLFEVTERLSVFHMVAQQGYGPSKHPRIRYRHLESCLNKLAAIAERQSASVHMPRIGCGQAGGNWAVVSELIDSSLCQRGIEVTVYDLESERSHWAQSSREPTLFDDLNVM